MHLVSFTKLCDSNNTAYIELFPSMYKQRCSREYGREKRKGGHVELDIYIMPS